MKGFRDLSRRDAMAGLAAAGLAGCSGPVAAPQSPVAQAQATPHPLWPTSGPPVLRGAVIAQRLRRPAVDGPLGTGFGGGRLAMPAYGRAEFEALAEAGANLVVMSFGEFWTPTPPYRRQDSLAEELVGQMDAAKAAGLFTVLGLRSGPGRSDFIFHRDAADTWFPKELIIDRIWRDREAQAAWGEMCVDAARIVAPRSDTAGLILMVEPDVNYTGADHEGRELGVWEPDEYARKVSELSDWRRIAGDCARKVRETSADLPLLISPPAFARTDFLKVMGEPPVPGTVWCVHDYEPREFTHYPRQSAGIVPFQERRNEFETRMAEAQAQGAPVFLGEFGAARWAGDAGKYHAARVAACEKLGVNWAVFRWPTLNKAYEEADDMFDVTRSGDEPRTLDALKAAWARNSLRP